MANCTKKINQELTLLENFNDIITTSVARTPIKYTTSMAKTHAKYTTSVAKTSIKHTANAAEYATEYAVEHIVEHATKHAALCTSIKDTTSAARTPTKDLLSAAKKLLDINMISAVFFNHLIQKLQKNLDIQIFSVTLQDINIVLAPK